MGPICIAILKKSWERLWDEQIFDQGKVRVESSVEAEDSRASYRSNRHFYVAPVRDKDIEFTVILLAAGSLYIVQTGIDLTEKLFSYATTSLCVPVDRCD